MWVAALARAATRSDLERVSIQLLTSWRGIATASQEVLSESAHDGASTSAARLDDTEPGPFPRTRRRRKQGMEVLPQASRVLKELDFTAEQRALILRRYPSIQGADADNMYACFQGLRELGFHREDIRILWCRCPQLAVINPHGRPAALLNWLESLGLSRAAALKTLKRQPQMAGLSIINNLEPSLEFLKETLDLSPEALGRFIVANPNILSCSIGTVQDIITSYLQAGLSREELSRLCSSYPAILRMPINTPTNLKKVAFLEQHLKLNIVGTLTKVPNILNYSLGRIAERSFFAMEHGRFTAGKTGSLSTLLALADAGYVRLLGTTLEEFAAWREMWRASHEAQAWLPLRLLQKKKE